VEGRVGVANLEEVGSFMRLCIIVVLIHAVEAAQAPSLLLPAVLAPIT
jgi:hypothetical protein